MPHRYVTKEVLDRLREEIAKQDVQISKIRSIARKDRDGIEVFLDRVRQLFQSARQKRDSATDMLMEDGRPRQGPNGEYIAPPLLDATIQEKMALIFRGEEKAFEAVLQMFDNPDQAVDIFVEEKNALQLKLKEYEKLEIRSNPAPDER